MMIKKEKLSSAITSTLQQLHSSCIDLFPCSGNCRSIFSRYKNNNTSNNINKGNKEMTSEVGFGIKPNEEVKNALIVAISDLLKLNN